MKDHIKVLSTLSLSVSDAREDTLTSVILNTLYEKAPVKHDSICKVIEALYGFDPYKDEVVSLLKHLTENNVIENKDGEGYTLTEDEKNNWTN